MNNVRAAGKNYSFTNSMQDCSIPAAPLGARAGKQVITPISIKGKKGNTFPAPLNTRFTVTKTLGYLVGDILAGFLIVVLWYIEAIKWEAKRNG